MTITNLSAQQLRRAAALREKIDALEKALAVILNATTPSAPVVGRRAGRRAAKAASAVAAPKAKRRISKAARAKMAAAAKARWAKAKAAGKTSLKASR
jgi:hypothetical protein